jgi:competence protein ComEC
VALAVGETQYVSIEQWRIFNATGITHLIAISGLHVTLFSLLMSALARRLWTLVPAFQGWRRESFAALLGVTAAGAYALLSGFSVPTQRTLIMLATWHLLRAAARHPAAAPALPVALLLVLLLDPLASLAAGFWLSFVAVAVLLHATTATSGGHLDCRALWHTQWRVAAGLLPVTVAVFGSVSMAGLVVNFIVIPLFSLLLVPLVLAATVALALCPLLADWLLWLLAWLHAWFWPALVAVGQSDFALWRMQPPWWWFVLAVPAAALTLLSWRWSPRFTALLALLPALYPLTRTLQSGEFRLTVLDVGRGLAVVVQTARHALLFDNGESWGSNGAQSRGAVVPALRALRVTQLDQVWVPKLNNDRAAGLVILAAELPVREWQAGPGALPPEFQPLSAWRPLELGRCGVSEPERAGLRVACGGGRWCCGAVAG